MKSFRLAIAALAVTALVALPISAQAGGSWGGSSGGGYASSGGHSGGGFFSRLKARHSGGSSGGRVAAGYGSNGGSRGGSSGGVSRPGPLRRMVANIRARKAARHSARYSSRHGGSSGGYRGGSSGGASYARYASASSGGSASAGRSLVSYHGGGSGGSSGGVATPSYSSSYSQPVVQSVSMGASTSYESPVIESAYEAYTPMGETIIDDGGYSSGETIIDGGYDTGYPAGETIIDGGYETGGYETGESIIDGGSVNASAPTSNTLANSDRYESAKPAMDPDAALLTVKVPFKAVVTVNDHETESDGSLRKFMSRGLKDGYVYTYVVKVAYEVNGEAKTDTKSVKLRPGDVEEVTFESPANQSNDSLQARKVPAGNDVITVVQLHVPANAVVSLAGNPTQGSGPLRTFRTKQLAAGQQWSDYTVRVTATVDGQSITKERTVTVEAGSLTELTFDFDDNTIASR